MANKVKALQQWCKLQVEGYRDVNITNMTSSWRSGLAFCALIHRYRPDLIDYDSLSKEDVFINNELAFRVAKESLDIPDLLEAEDMVAMSVPDKLCIVTYVSQYYNVMRSMKPGGGPGQKRSPLKRPQTITQPDETQAKRFTMENTDLQMNTTSGRLTNKQSMGDKCHLCHQKVYVVERHLEGGKLYHRHCYRESQKSSLRSYRTTHPKKPPREIKENISPTATVNTVSNVTAINGTSSSSTKSMAKLWDTKFAAGHQISPPPSTLSVVSDKLLPSVVSSKGSSKSPSSSPSTSSPPISSTFNTSSRNSTANARPKSWSVANNKENTARPWSPPSISPLKQSPTVIQSPALSHISSSSSCTSSTTSPSSGSSPAQSQPRSFFPGSTTEPLSPSAKGLFPHFRKELSPSVPAAPQMQPMDVVVDTGTASGWNCSPSKKYSTAETESKLTSPTTRLDQEPAWKSDPAVKSSLLTSLVNIRQRYGDTKKGDDNLIGEKPLSTSNIVIKPKNTDYPKKLDQPKSILKNEDGQTCVQNRPILKHKDPVSFNDCDPISSDTKPLRSILKSENELGPNAMNTSPRSILKHHDESAEESYPCSNHSILKSESTILGENNSESSSILRRSILKTKDSNCDSDSISNHDDSPRPGRSILKSRKSSGDSLLSSGDELDEFSPRPILKTSPWTECAMSPTTEPRSILKSKNLTARNGDNTRDSPKTILKSRESSPTQLMSPLRVSEPVKPILKKGVESPKPIHKANILHGKAKSPIGPSLLKAKQSEEASNSTSSFAAFKTPTPKNYTSSASIGICSSLTKPFEPANKPVGSFKTDNDSFAFSKSEKTNETIKAKHSEQVPPLSKCNGDKTIYDKKTSNSVVVDSKPVWMFEAEKRMIARKGNYVDPEKVPVHKTDTNEKTGIKESPPKSIPQTVEKSKTSNAVLDTVQVDTRPEWQKEAEKRQVMRKGQYHDPEKGPLSQKDRFVSNGKKEVTNGLTNVDVLKNGEHQTAKEVTLRDRDLILKPKIPTASPSLGLLINTRPKSAIPPPKPMRSPMPERAINERPKTVTVANVDKPAKADWQLEADRRHAALQKKYHENPSELKMQKTPPPPRPSQPPQFKRKKISSESSIDFEDESNNHLGNNADQYAEIGPASKRTPGKRKSGIQVEQNGKFANRPLPDVPDVQDQDTPKRRVNAEARLSSRTIMRRLEDLDVDLQALEKEGRRLEEAIRSEPDDAMDEADLMISWFELVNKKNELVRKESDLMYRHRQQELEGQHEELEYELRCLMDKTDKTSSEKVREDALLQELVETVMRRNHIVDSIEEDRLRYLEEDQEINQMMKSKVYTRSFSLKSESPEPKPEPEPEPEPELKNGKVKKNKSKKEKKDKNRKRSKSSVR